MDHPAIDDVCVISVYNKDQETEVPRAYVVAAEKDKAGDEQAQEIIKWLDGKVANHKKLRGGVKFIEEIPKSASGKILRRVLKDKVKQEEGSDGKSKL